MCEYRSSVQNWLQILRNVTENYDPIREPIESTCDQSEPEDIIIKFPVTNNCDKRVPKIVASRDQSDSNLNSSAAKIWDQSESIITDKVESEIADTTEQDINIALLFSSLFGTDDQSEPEPAENNNAKMTSESENLKRLSALTGSYENIWNCSTGLKYGHECRVSCEFDETVQELCIAPFVLTKFDFSIPTNIIQWQTELLYECSSEEEDNEEYEKSLERISEEKGQISFNQTRPFPVDNTVVEVRHNAGSVRRPSYRSQTVHEFAYGNIQQQLEESQVDIDIQLDIKGVIKVCYDGTTRKLTKGQLLRIGSDQMTLIADKTEEEVIIDHLSQTQYKPTSKKEITITKTVDDMCKVYKLQFDSTKDTNLAVMDLERYYGNDRSPHCNKIQTGEEKLQIRQRLLRLLGKRSSKDLLEKKGIIRNEPIFGNTLKHLYEMYKQEVPEYVKHIVQLIELPKNIKSIGLYRTSGNLATIQKIRFHIDKNNLKILDEFKNDIDVLTGSLKLFFRELKEPLIPHKTYEELCKYIETNMNAKSEEHIKNLINKLEKPHKKTLLTLIEHLLKVEMHSEENRMDAYNISIVWGPTLIWPPDNCHENILLSHTNASKVIELLLIVYKKAIEVPYKNESSPKISYKEENEDGAAKQKNALMLELSENLTHSLKRIGSKDNLMKSTDSLTKFKSEQQKSPDKEMKYDLEHLCANTKEKIPEFVLKVVPLIEKGINTEYLYKKNGSTEKLEKIKKKITKTKSNLNSMEKYNVHDLTLALKNFFYELKTPLIPKETFEKLVLATDERLEITKLRNTKKELDNSTIPNRETLDYLVRHLVKVSMHEESNKMSKHNIATEWATILCRSFIENHEISFGSCIQVVETLLQIYDNKTVIHMGSERDYKHNIDVYNSIYNSESCLGKSPDKSEDSQMSTTHYLGRSPDKNEKSTNLVLPSTFKRKPKIAKNDSSLYRVSRYITNTLSMYDNVHYAEHVRDEATILESPPVKNSKKTMEDRTKL